MNHPVAPRAEFTTYFKAAARRATKLHQLCLCCRAVWVGRSLGRSARIKERFRKMAWYGSDWQLLRRRCSTHRKQKASLPSHLANGAIVYYLCSWIMRRRARLSCERREGNAIGRPAAAFLRRWMRPLMGSVKVKSTGPSADRALRCAIANYMLTILLCCYARAQDHLICSDWKVRALHNVWIIYNVDWRAMKVWSGTGKLSRNFKLRRACIGGH